jgi:hypothetical protein
VIIDDAAVKLLRTYAIIDFHVFLTKKKKEKQRKSYVEITSLRLPSLCHQKISD